VFIIAKHLPGDDSIDYTSPWYVPIHLTRTFIFDTLHRAGAHWRSHAPASDPEQQRWDVETYKHWVDVIKKEQQNPSQKLLSGLAVSYMVYPHSFLSL
jgi:D-amino-acid oxidase